MLPVTVTAGVAEAAISRVDNSSTMCALYFDFVVTTSSCYSSFPPEPRSNVCTATVSSEIFCPYFLPVDLITGAVTAKFDVSPRIRAC